MRTVIALFDAPAPARAAAAAVVGLGIGAADFRLFPPLPGGPAGPPDFLAGLGGDDPRAWAQALTELGLDGASARAYAEALARGAILLAVRVPTLTAPLVQRAIDGAAPLELAEHQAMWASDPGFCYAWSAPEPPLDEAPAVLSF
jgi:hypothetical protein